MDWLPGTPSPVAWFLYAVAAIYLILFFAYFLVFARAHRLALRKGGLAVAKYNALLRGFPNGFYAKMMGRRPL